MNLHSEWGRYRERTDCRRFLARHSAITATPRHAHHNISGKREDQRQQGQADQERLAERGSSNSMQLLSSAKLLDLDFSPGVESLEVQLFAEDEIPWDTLAFHAIRYSLQHYFADRKRGEFIFRDTDLKPPTR